MDIVPIKEAIIKTTFTKTDVLRRLRMVREYCEYKYFQSEEKGTLTDFFVIKKIPMEDRKVLTQWGDQFIPTITKETMYKIIEAVEDWVNKEDIFNLYLSYDPTDEDIVRYIDILRNSIKKDLIIEIHIDKTLMGGCSYAYRGIYHDFTIRYWMLKYRDDILTIIDKHAKQMGLGNSLVR